MRALPVVIASLALVAAPSCKNAEQSREVAKSRTFQDKLDEGRGLLDHGQLDEAEKAFKQATNLDPKHPEPHLLLGEAHRQRGNLSAAVLSVKYAGELSKPTDLGWKRTLIELYRQGGNLESAAAELLQLRNARQIKNPEVLLLGRLQAYLGDREGAVQTLEWLRRNGSADPDTEVTEAELLLLTGQELDAAKQMDSVLKAFPTLTSGRLARARYFLHNGRAQLALKDIDQIPAPDSRRPDVVALRASATAQLGYFDDAQQALAAVLQTYPNDVQVLAQLAELELEQSNLAAAVELVDRALDVRPNYPRALTVRGRILEARKDPAAALETYEQALKVDPLFTPALSRMWRVHVSRRELPRAMGVLERLWQLNEITIDEKASLAELYVKQGIQLGRAQDLIAEAMATDAQNPRYVQIQGLVEQRRFLGGPKVKAVDVK